LNAGESQRRSREVKAGKEDREGGEEVVLALKPEGFNAESIPYPKANPEEEVWF
jgi:hypothetical protein